MSFSVSHRSRSQFADMPGCSGGGGKTIPAGRGKNMQREREGEGEGAGGMLMNLIRANWRVYLVSKLHFFFIITTLKTNSNSK